MMKSIFWIVQVYPSQRMHETERGCMNQKVVVWNRKKCVLVHIKFTHSAIL